MWIFQGLSGMSCGNVGRRGDEISWRKECRERIRVAMMCDDAGQQRLRTAEERLAPASAASEVKYKNFVEQCVRHLEEKETC